MKTLILFPNQLFSKINFDDFDQVLLIEHPLFFGTDEYQPQAFHKQKLVFHRATMKEFYNKIKHKNKQYLNYDQSSLNQIKSNYRITDLSVFNPEDYLIERRLNRWFPKHQKLSSPAFINSNKENQEFLQNGKKIMRDFYQYQRRKLNILLDETGKPISGKWSFDSENRKKIPKSILDDLPVLEPKKKSKIVDEAIKYIEKNFPDNPGSIDNFYYAVTRSEAQKELQNFLNQRLSNFGTFEDAIVPGRNLLFHSLLTPYLNVGLLTPLEVVNLTLEHSKNNDIPLNSIEGFVRQIIGWREFMRAQYRLRGTKMRNSNHWEHYHKMPKCFYDASSGIDPVDDVIRRIIETGYTHHIERLMTLGGFFFLCRIDPQEIYKWFMELFIDSYDWVMVPNVYAMSQNSAGGLITTKPYFSGSNYIRKMSHYKDGEWSKVWDGLYWSFIFDHQKALSKNPRWSIMCRLGQKMDQEKVKEHKKNAREFLAKIHN